MGLVKKQVLFLLIVILCSFEFSEGVVTYKVGDSAGWAMIGNVDYNSWASSKTFQVGDILLFEYDPSYHNVLQVSRSDFHLCDVTAPIATYATGNDSIPIRSSGHYYYICGFVGHCQAGQKVDIRVPKSSQSSVSPTSSPVQGLPVLDAPPHASLVGPVSPAPFPNGGECLVRCNKLFYCYIQFVWILIWIMH